MRSHTITILVLATFAFQVLFGGFGRYGVVCLSSDHGPSSHSTESTCQAACDHEETKPSLSLHDKHESDCGCVDIEFDTSDVLSTVRTHAGDVVDLPAPFDLSRIIAILPEEPAWQGPAVPPKEDFGTAQSLASINSTRLII